MEWFTAKGHVVPLPYFSSGEGTSCWGGGVTYCTTEIYTRIHENQAEGVRTDMEACTASRGRQRPPYRVAHAIRHPHRANFVFLFFARQWGQWYKPRAMRAWTYLGKFFPKLPFSSVELTTFFSRFWSDY